MRRDGTLSDRTTQISPPGDLPPFGRAWWNGAHHVAVWSDGASESEIHGVRLSRGGEIVEGSRFSSGSLPTYLGRVPVAATARGVSVMPYSRVRLEGAYAFATRAMARILQDPVVEEGACEGYIPGARVRTGRATVIVGTSAEDALSGSPGPDVICGLGGDDEIRGRAGVDQVLGGAGHDRLFGNPHSDELFGGEDNDDLRGGRQLDALDGGPGTDSCRLADGDTHSECETE